MVLNNSLRGLWSEESPDIYPLWLRSRPYLFYRLILKNLEDEILLLDTFRL